MHLAHSPGAAQVPAIRRLIPWLALLSLFVFPMTGLAGPTFGFLEDFADGTTAGFISAAQLSNPGTGGVGGVGDGYLLIVRPDSLPGHLGAHNRNPDYAGNYLAAGVTRIVFQLNDVDRNQAFEIHLAIGNGGNFWQYNTGFSPPEQSWGQFQVDLTDSLNFSRIIGVSNYTLALTTADRLLFRHDLPPYTMTPDNISGELGIDRIFLTGPTNGIPDPDPNPSSIRPIVLLPAQPNPARPATTISANVASPSEVRLRIVSVAGRIVRQLYGGTLDAGLHTFPWDGRDERGMDVNGGVYLIELQAGGRTEVGRITLFR